MEHLDIANKKEQSAVEMEQYARLIEKERVRNALLEQQMDKIKSKQVELMV